jgi:hypothetical protein
MLKTTRAKYFTLFALGAVLIAGCGGGGGGSTSTSVSYAGVTTEAAVTDTNAETLTAAAIDTAGSSELGTLVIAGDVTEQGTAQGLSLPGVARLLADMKNLGQLAGPATAAGSAASQTVTGSCGGSATMSGTNSGDDVNVNITGSITYSAYCESTPEGNATINGSITFTLVGTASDFTFTVSTSYLAITAGGQSVAYSLSYTLTANSSTATATMTANYRASDGKVYRVENYQVVLSNGGQTVAISGRLYHPDYGYVTVSTPTPLQYSNCYGYYRPTSGVLRVTGAGGVYAEFMPQDCGQYQVCLTDGGTVCNLLDW